MPKAVLQPSSLPPLRPRRGVRRAVETGVGSLIALALIVAWHVEWFEVPSGSMAPTLLGRHRHLVCRDCGHEFDCGADETGMAGKRAVCPNCDYEGSALESTPAVRGDRVLVHCSAFELRAPRRWELAAFRNPRAAGQILVKRIAGLPNEKIEIRRGDIYADGEIKRKTLSEQRGVAILVHDGNSLPQRTAGLPSRWQGEPETTRWRQADGRFAFPAIDRSRSPASQGNEIDWLAYRHWRRRPGAADEAEEAPITDQCGYNQTRPVVESYPVRDLLVSCRLRVSGEGSLAWFATDGQAQFLVELFPAEGRIELRRDGTPVASVADLAAFAGRDVQLELSLFDAQVLLALDGKTALAYPYVADGTPFRPTSRPLAVGSQGLGIELWDVKLLRDIYYTPPGGNGRRPGAGVVQYQLGADEYLMLGDNSPLSADSRSWPDAPAAPRELLIGKPFVVYLPSRFLSWRGGGFQVPEPSKIRYIH